MGDSSKIEWTDATWNVITGCTKVSPGCDFCYAERIVNRFGGAGAFDEVTIRADRLLLPLRWTRPRRIFVNSMSDLFHDDVPDEIIAMHFAVMALAGQHTFQVLTKRHGRMRSLLSSDGFRRMVDDAAGGLLPTLRPPGQPRHLDLDRGGVVWPVPNVWLGVSVEDQKWADVRIPALLATPAAVRFLSCEPLLGPVDLTDALTVPVYNGSEVLYRASRYPLADPYIGWVIVGGESGPKARPMHPDWVRSIRDQCEAEVIAAAFHFKQWGEWAPATRDRATHLLNVSGALVTVKDATSTQSYGSGPPTEQDLIDRGHPGWVRIRKVGKKLAGRELDGRTWDEWPVER